MFWLLLVVMYALSSSTFVVGSLAMQHVSPIFFIGMRMMLAAPVLFLYLFLRAKACRIRAADILSVLLLGVVQIFIPLVGEAYALTTLSAAKVSLIWSLSPFMTAIFSWSFFGERITKTKFFGLMVGIAGFIPLVVHAGISSAQSLFTVGFADAILILVVISSAFAWNLFRKLLQKGYQSLQLNAWSMLFAGILSIALSYRVDSWSPLPVDNWSVVLMCLVYLVIIGNIIFYNLYGYMLHHYTATLLSFAGGSTPFLTALLQWIFLGQPVGIAFFMSLGIIIIGLFIFYKEDLRQGYIARSLQSKKS